MYPAAIKTLENPGIIGGVSEINAFTDCGCQGHVMIPIVEKRIEICEQLAGEYGMKQYQRIQNGE